MQRTTKSVLCILSLVIAIGLWLKATVIQVPSGTWAPAGNMAEARSGAASVLLQDGTILVTGGEGASGALASAEFFNAGSFAPAPAMNVARSGHAAVVLKDGRVLVTGGKTSGGGVTNAAEVYSPAMNSWIVIGSMADARSGHTATLLKDGRVFLAGGEGSAGAVSTLEVFDPAAGTFTFAGTMSSSRKAHAAALLADGQVMIAGGSNGSVALATSEMFNSETGAVAAGPALSTSRAGASATTLLDGKVLIAGGNNGSADLATAEVYDPATGVVSVLGSSLATARRNHLAFLLPNNNHVLIVGGSSGVTALATTEIFRPWNGSFYPTGSMSAGRTGASGSPLALDGLLLVAGGTGLVNSELYGFATVKTDRDDYAPGELVTITGSGWQPGETVTLFLHEINNPDPHDDLTLTAVADASGRIVNNQFAPDEHDLNVTFFLTAQGTSSQAQTTFTDGQPQSVDLDPTSRSVAPGGIALYTTLVDMVGNSNACTVNLEVITVLPTGASASFNSNPVALANGNGATDFSRTLSITTTSAGPSATPPGTYPFTVRATRGSGCQGTAGTGPTRDGTLIVFGPATHLVFNQQPTNTLAGNSITPAPTVRVLDANDNLVANSSIGIIIAIGNNPGGGTLSGTLTQNAVNGEATFPGLSINKAGTGYTLAASSAGLAGATSSAFNITAGPVAQLVFTTQPVGNTAGNPFTTQPVVAVQDVFGNTRTTGQGNDASIALSIVSGTGAAGAVLTCNVNPLGASAGVASFAGCKINLAGTGYRLRASTTIAGNPFTVDSNLFDITAVNATPSVTANDQAFSEGASTSYSASWSDGLDSSQNHTCTINFGDGTGPQVGVVSPAQPAASGTCSLSHTYADGPNSYTITVTVNDGTINGSDTATATVNNVAPTASIVGAPASSPEGTSISLTSTVTDPSSVDTAAGFTYAWSVTKNGNPFSSGSASSLSFTPDDNGTYVVSLGATDKDLGTGTDSKTITVTNVAPTASILGAPASSLEGTLISLGTTTPIDPSPIDTAAGFSFSWTVTKNSNPFASGSGTTTFSFTPDDNGTYVVTMGVTDKDLGTGLSTASIVVTNAAPNITGVSGPMAPIAVGSPEATVTITTDFSDAGIADTHACTYSWDDKQPPQVQTSTAGVVTEAAGAGSCTGTFPYTVAGVYSITVVVQDDDGASATSKFEFVVIYDPSAGFVTGGGWIQSPAGAYVAGPALTGKANFGFVSKYLKGSNVPTGETEFQLHFATFNFQSTSYQWLVVSGARAQYKGSGKINGAGSYGFLLTGTDGQVTGGGGVDKFRIKIWDIATNAIVYDNVPTATSDDIDAANPQSISGGSITIHAPKK